MLFPCFFVCICTAKPSFCLKTTTITDLPAACRQCRAPHAPPSGGGILLYVALLFVCHA